MKDKVAAVVDARSDSLKSLAREIFSYEETAFQEVRSSRALARGIYLLLFHNIFQIVKYNMAVGNIAIAHNA